MNVTSDITRNMKFFLLSQKYNWKSFFVAYRAQAITWTVIQGIGTLATIISISVIYSVSSGLPGWTYFQLLALSAIAQISGGILWYFINPTYIANSMRGGGLDQLLLKPYNIIIVIFSRYSHASSIGMVISGIALLVYALSNVKIGVYAFLAFVPAYLAGMSALIFATLAITFASYVAFKDANFIHWGINIAQQASQYPAAIYGMLGLTVLSIVVPMTFASYFPAMILFGKTGYVYAASTALIAIGISVGLYELSLHLLKRYESGGG
ncbi:MAG: ABC-2 family transporter protein [Candidatus Marsarchaeota archaeon]|nr:ABC-2 family transporter protein [Candidatus Marsarchaeota archaeon]